MTSTWNPSKEEVRHLLFDSLKKAGSNNPQIDDLIFGTVHFYGMSCLLKDRFPDTDFRNLTDEEIDIIRNCLYILIIRSKHFQEAYRGNATARYDIEQETWNKMYNGCVHFRIEILPDIRDHLSRNGTPVQVRDVIEYLLHFERDLKVRLKIAPFDDFYHFQYNADEIIAAYDAKMLREYSLGD
ncbi:hypothetical protein PRIPAC_97840 [Pristionchus pacificus]|uniref:Uncharacterized protein n=1 Tax=Pristionchus pacificus TaxID=54126 RepID=A0A2A6CGH7_PRIPA|nr:hypothetical protein PRIPAC_97840 [Pristionchus pacificus]|eukprot:PDM77312.1 hypothetical protein PRIPAC_40262 [Pristionchus pacificus]